jgi:hypothetical protein
VSRDGSTRTIASTRGCRISPAREFQACFTATDLPRHALGSCQNGLSRVGDSDEVATMDLCDSLTRKQQYASRSTHCRNHANPALASQHVSGTELTAVQAVMLSTRTVGVHGLSQLPGSSYTSMRYWLPAARNGWVRSASRTASRLSARMTL